MSMNSAAQKATAATNLEALIRTTFGLGVVSYPQLTSMCQNFCEAMVKQTLDYIAAHAQTNPGTMVANPGTFKVTISSVDYPVVGQGVIAGNGTVS